MEILGNGHNKREEGTEGRKQEDAKKKKTGYLRSFFGKKENLILMILGGVLLMVLVVPSSEQDASESSSLLSDYPSLTASDSLNLGTDLLTAADSLNLGTDLLTASESWNLETDLQAKASNAATSDEMQSGIESRLEELLLQMEICDEVKVMITYKEGVAASSQYDYCYSYPELEGIVVVCNQGDDAQKAEKVTAVIQALFSVEAHKIKVANMKSSANGG